MADPDHSAAVTGPLRVVLGGQAALLLVYLKQSAGLSGPALVVAALLPFLLAGYGWFVWKARGLKP